ncbi:AMP-binding protein [Paracandidimonas lactea]|uniref:AMP-binding protein n=1 Tax=Paracandidimonas lactea TaxID=2895524 RepID=UPI001F318657|nr:AMP-binding protein [Paracandidimonas lactea]
MNFPALLARHCAEKPHATAFYDVDAAVSYTTLAAEADRVAALLHARGARAGDRLALWLPNCTPWLVIFLACARLGVTVVAMNTRFRSREVGDLISRGRCRWLAMWPSFKGLPFRQILNDVEPALLAGLEAVLVVGEDAAGAEAPVLGKDVLRYTDTAPAGILDRVPTPADTTQALVYTTSGTTSLPKLVVHDQRTLLGHGAHVAAFQGITGGDAVLLGAPLCGAFGFSSALAGLAVGAPLVSSPVLDAAQCVRQIRQYGVTHTFANNELLARILDTAGDQPAPLPTLRIAGFASFAPSLNDLPERAARAGITLVGLYGSSELQALIAAQPADAPATQRHQAGGRLAWPEASVRVRDTASGALLPYGEVGEIEIRSPSLMKQYLDNDAATRAAIDDEGYFRTGDLGLALDERSFIFRARKGDYLRLSGFLVNPVEIERFIETLDGVQACQVVGAEHAGKTVPVAFFITAAGKAVSEAAIIAHCKASLAHFKVPVRAAMIDTFPVVESANSNKIQRGRLQEMARALLDTPGSAAASRNTSVAGAHTPPGA